MWLACIPAAEVVGIPSLLLLTWLVCALGKENVLQMLEVAQPVLYDKTELGSPAMEGGNEESEIFYKHSYWLAYGFE